MKNKMEPVEFNHRCPYCEEGCSCKTIECSHCHRIEEIKEMDEPIPIYQTKTAIEVIYELKNYLMQVETKEGIVDESLIILGFGSNGLEIPEFCKEQGLLFWIKVCKCKTVQQKFDCPNSKICRMPLRNQDCIVWDNTDKQMRLATFANNDFIDYESGYSFDKNITHWIPLLSPPKL